MKPLIEMQNACKTFFLRDNPLIAMENVSLAINPGETLGLVGESGCGKSTTGRCILGLERLSSGRVFFEGEEISTLATPLLRRKAQIIFQDPYSSLNPRMTAAEIVAEPLHIHKQDAHESEIARLFDLVGLSHMSMGRFPHEFSGGQRQRIGIARALAIKPSFVVCDEPISALDVSVQAQIVNLLKELQQRLSLSYLFIAHDLAMVKYISHRVAVMYLGRIVETAPAEELYHAPLHPYTQALLLAIPIPDPYIERKRKRILLKGEPPSPLAIYKGCPFASRCPHAIPLCEESAPSLREIAPGHHVACHLVSISK